MIYHTDDTIAAISTALAPSGIGIVRISGKDACSVADVVYKGKNNKKLKDQAANTVHYGHIVTGEKTLDEVLVMILKAPHSYTGEDTVEIDCHGGVLAVKRVLEAVLAAGARLAEPGEFTKRAFLNGRIDLSQAEAVMDVISAKSTYALDSSMSQLSGSLGEKISGIRQGLLYELAYMESALDDPEHYSLDGFDERVTKALDTAAGKIRKLIESSERGRYIGEGIKTVILGKPNAGKSSILNMISGKERAIVTDIPGTTRDVIEENVQIGGISLRILDTAGIRYSEDTVEKIGIDLAKKEASDADLIIFAADSSVPLDENDLAITERIKDKRVIVLLNKSDLETVTSKEDIKKLIDRPVIETSAKTGSGLEELEETIKNMFFDGEISFNEEVFITNARHKSALEQALGCVLLAKEGALEGIPEDVYSVDIYGAINALDLITGGDLSEDLVNEIFEKFCMGK